MSPETAVTAVTAVTAATTAMPETAGTTRTTAAATATATATAAAGAKPTVNRRLGGRKDRTGCTTCKIRRVKCDEEKPACKRCTSTGRACDGYAPVASRPKANAVHTAGQSSSVSSSALATLLCAPQHKIAGGAPTNQQEHLAFQFFVHTGASSLAGCTDVDFWTRLVPQCAQADAAIYHASVAVGALLTEHHQRSSSSQRHSLVVPRTALKTLAIERQNRAVKWRLCVCVDTASRQLAQSSFPTSETKSSHTMIAGLAAQLDRIRVQCGMFNGGTANATSPVHQEATLKMLANPPTAPFASLDAARDEMSELVAAVQHIVGARWGEVEDPATDPQRNVTQTQAPDAALHGWRSRFEQFVSVNVNATSSNDNLLSSTASLLRLRYLISRVWMTDAPGRSEMAYDDELVSVLFRDIAAEVDICLHATGSGVLGYFSGPFTFEMGLTPPLYWALLKCRHPRLRRRLLALLGQAPAQEGLWSRDIMVQVAEKVIAHEEAGMLENGLDMPLERHRIKTVRINLRTTLPDGRRGDVVQCFGMPYGSNGGLHVILEFVAFCIDAMSV